MVTRHTPSIPEAPTARRPREGRRRFRAHRGLCLLIAGCLLSSAGARAQSNSVLQVAPQGRLILQGAGGQVVIPGPTVIQFQSGQPVMDPLLASAMQQSGMDPRVMAQAEFDPPAILPGGHATYRVVVTAMIEGVSLPEKLPVPPGLELTPTSRAFNYGSIGAGIQPRTTLNFRGTAQTPGTYVIPAYEGSANGRPVTIPETRLTVLASGVPPPSFSPRLLLEVPPGEFYVGQAVPVAVVTVDRGDNSLFSAAQAQVTGDAFVTDQVLTRYRREMRTIDGRNVAVHVSDLTVIPIKEGRNSLRAQALAMVNGMPPGAGITLPNYYPLIDSEPVTVTVRHLPKAGELPGFTGGIGRFQLDPPRASTNVVRAGDPFTLTVTVRGEGNLARLLPPKPGDRRDWQIFPASADPADPMTVLQRGATVFTYTLIPLSEGSERTPAIPFCYFDPAKKTYADLTIPGVPIQVLPAPGNLPRGTEPIPAATPGQPRTPAEQPLAMAGLADSPGREVASVEPVQEREWFLRLQCLPALALGGWWAWHRRRRYLTEHPEVVLKARARRGLRRELRRVRRAGAAGDAAGFIRAATHGLRQAAAPHAAANPEALVCADVLEAMPATERNGAPGELVQNLFAAADARQFVGQAANEAALLGRQPEFEQLAERWRERLGSQEPR